MNYSNLRAYYEDNGIVVYHGDASAILPSLPDKCADLILTDPPYGCDNNASDLRALYTGSRKHKLSKRSSRHTMKGTNHTVIVGDSDSSAYELLLVHAKRLMAPGAAACICCGGGGPEPRFAEWTLLMQKAIGFKMCVVWDKMKPGIGWHYRRTWECILVSETNKWNGGLTQQNIIHMPGINYSPQTHPTEKPIELMKLFIGLHSNTGELVLDPFAGSLTTLVAAKQMGRRAIGIEVDEQWLKIGLERLRQTQLLPDDLRQPEQMEMLQ